LVRQGGKIKAKGIDMRGWGTAAVTAIMIATAGPALGQAMNGSEGEAFLTAVKEGDASKALPMIDSSGGRIVNFRGFAGDTALHIATRQRETDWVGHLLGKGADPNIGDRNGDTPMILAARIGMSDAVGWMLARNARVDTANKRGETALIVAVQARQPEIVEMLLEAGADADKADFAAGYSARDYAKRDSRNPRILKLIETVKSTRRKAAGPNL
jgi:ankyrin repeat protein